MYKILAIYVIFKIACEYPYVYVFGWFVQDWIGFERTKTKPQVLGNP
jgi:hypothetical protein